MDAKSGLGVGSSFGKLRDGSPVVSMWDVFEAAEKPVTRVTVPGYSVVLKILRRIDPNAAELSDLEVLENFWQSLRIPSHKILCRHFESKPKAIFLATPVPNIIRILLDFERHLQNDEQAAVQTKPMCEPATVQTRSASEKEIELPWYEPGAFWFNGQQVEFSGLPLKLLVTLHNARFPLCLQDIKEQIGQDELAGDTATREIVSRVRKTLNTLVERHAIDNGEADPIPCKDSSYRLVIDRKYFSRSASD